MKIPLIKAAISTFLISSCMFFPNKKIVQLQLNPKNSGWYFMQIRTDSTIQDSALIKRAFDDTTRFVDIKISKLEGTTVSPIDFNGNDISKRLKSLGFFGAYKKEFFEFYNPTDEELKNIAFWSSQDDRVMEIRLQENKEFGKYYAQYMRAHPKD